MNLSQKLRVIRNKMIISYFFVSILLLGVIYYFQNDLIIYRNSENYPFLLIYLFFFCLTIYILYECIVFYFNYFIVKCVKQYLIEKGIIEVDKSDFQTIGVVRKIAPFQRNMHPILFERNFFELNTSFINIKTREVIHWAGLLNYVPNGYGAGYYMGKKITDHYLLWEIHSNKTIKKDLKINELFNNSESYCIEDKILYIKQKLDTRFLLFSIGGSCSFEHIEKQANTLVQDFNALTKIFSD